MAGGIETLSVCPCCLREWVKRHIKVPPAGLEYDEECPICHEPYSTRAFSAHIAVSITDVPSCPGHVLGLECIAGWIADKATNNTCPLCRGELFYIRDLHNVGEGQVVEGQDGEGVEDAELQGWAGAGEDEEEQDDDMPSLEEASEFGDVTDAENTEGIGRQKSGSAPHNTSPPADMVHKEQDVETMEAKTDFEGVNILGSGTIMIIGESQSTYEHPSAEEREKEKQESEDRATSDNDSPSDREQTTPGHATEASESSFFFSDAESDLDSDDGTSDILYPLFMGNLRNCLIEAVHRHRYENVSQRINDLEDITEQLKKDIEERKNAAALNRIYVFFSGAIVGGLLILKWPRFMGMVGGEYFGSV